MKAQMQSQMFIYILTVVIIGLLLFFGVKWIKELTDTEQRVYDTKFKVSVENAFNTMRTQYQSSKTYEFIAPDALEEICFVDSQTRPGNQGVCNPIAGEYDPLMCNAWKDNTSGILFSPPIRADIVVGPIHIENVNKSICMDTVRNRRIKVKLIGLGNMVRVKLP